MKTQRVLVLATAILCSVVQGAPIAGGSAGAGNTQTDQERSMSAVVRNKYFYKAGRIEIGGTAGAMPYDSLVNHYMLGGKATWHLSDHYGWEILDAQLAFPAVTGYTSDLVKAKGISNLQTSKLNMILTTNLLVSPIYGKIRFFGSQVLYFDFYFSGGPGVARTETIKLSNSGGTAVTSSVRTGFEPAFDFGLGFKIFMNNAMGLMVDFRDYVTYTEVYGKKALKSNFSVFAGLSFFLPTF
jgi:outer membrane beta-barrel protein